MSVRPQMITIATQTQIAPTPLVPSRASAIRATLTVRPTIQAEIASVSV